MTGRFSKPTGAGLTAAQAAVVGAVLRYIHGPGYNAGRLRAGVDPFVEQMARACATDTDRAQFIAELERWIRWERVSAYWLTMVFVLAVNGVPTAHALTARRLYADALVGINDDLALMSLESAFNLGDRINAESPSGQIAAATMAIANSMHRTYSAYRNWYSRRPYTTIEPLSEHLYNLRSVLDLIESFPGLGPDFADQPAALMDVIAACGPDDVYLRVVARRYAGWAFERTNDPAAALHHYELGIAEATGAGVETEICHHLRYAANALRRAGQLDAAQSALRLALQLERHPELSYWSALSARELGRVLAHRANGPDAVRDATAAFDAGREDFEASLVSSVVPVARAIKQQMFRAYADDAIAFAFHTTPLALLSEIEAAGPRYATDVVVEGKLLRELPENRAQAYQAARAVFSADLGLFAADGDADDMDFVAYVTAVRRRRGEREMYIRERRALGHRLIADQGCESIVTRLLRLDLPGVAFLLFHLAQDRTYAMLVDLSTHGFRRESIDVGIDFWRTTSDTYHIAVAGAAQFKMSRHRRSVTALDALLATYQQTLAPLLERVLAHRGAKHLKIVPRLGLSEVPLHALVVGGKPLIEHCDISYVPTLGAFLALHEEAAAHRHGPSGPVSVVHDKLRAPAYGGTLRAIGDGDASRVEVIDAPTWEAFAAYVQTRHPIDVFFACHGLYDVNDPRRSALEFRSDLKISFAKIFTGLNLAGCRSVLMGACESGLGRTLVAAEYIALPLAFLANGVRYVIGTLWEVNQIASAILVARHYALVRAGTHSVPQALNAAQRHTMQLSQDDIVNWIRTFMPEAAPHWEPEFRKRGDFPFAHPYYWAGFYLTGAV